MAPTSIVARKHTKKNPKNLCASHSYYNKKTHI
jgi:hypothetical protein